VRDGDKVLVTVKDDQLHIPELHEPQSNGSPPGVASESNVE
jgi:hypothetical protein